MSRSGYLDGLAVIARGHPLRAHPEYVALVEMALHELRACCEVPDEHIGAVVLAATSLLSDLAERGVSPLRARCVLALAAERLYGINDQTPVVG